MTSSTFIPSEPTASSTSAAIAFAVPNHDRHVIVLHRGAQDAPQGDRGRGLGGRDQRHPVEKIGQAYDGAGDPLRLRVMIGMGFLSSRGAG